MDDQQQAPSITITTPESEWLTIRKAQEALAAQRNIHAGRSTINRWCRIGLFPGAKEPNESDLVPAWKIPPEAIAAFQEPQMGFPAGRKRKPRDPQETSIG